jgi:hypothetical protein
MHRSAEDLQQIERTVHRVPEVIVRISAPQSNDFGAVRKHLDHIARHGELMHGSHVGRRLIEAMDLDLEEYRRRPDLRVPLGRRPPKLVHKIILSMPSGTPPRGLLDAARAFLEEQFGNEHRYVFVLHTDRTHPYVHVVVKAVSERGVRLIPKKLTLRIWRSAFARHLRAQRIEASATTRASRRPVRANKSKAVYHIEQRGHLPHLRPGARVHPWRS